MLPDNFLFLQQERTCVNGFYEHFLEIRVKDILHWLQDIFSSLKLSFFV